MEHVLKRRGIDTSEDQTADVEGDKVTITDLDQRDPLGESKHFQLTSPLLRWQRSPHRWRWQIWQRDSHLHQALFDSAHTFFLS